MSLTARIHSSNISSEWRESTPGKRLPLSEQWQKGNLVVLNCHQVWPTDANKDWAGIDIFRFDEAGKIIEHWDVLQVVPAEARHENGMF